MKTRYESIREFLSWIENERRPEGKVLITLPSLLSSGGVFTILEIVKFLQRKHEVILFVENGNIHSDVVDVLTKLSCRIYSDHLFSIVPFSPFTHILVHSDSPNANFFFDLQADNKYLLKWGHMTYCREWEDKTLQLPWDKILVSTKFLYDKTLENVSPETKVEIIGWYHFTHSFFDNPNYKEDMRPPICIGYFDSDAIHEKNSREAREIIESLPAEDFQIYSIGSAIERSGEISCGFLDREGLSSLMKQLDIWLSPNINEGLNRMALEAFSASTLVIARHDDSHAFFKDRVNCFTYKTVPEAVEKIKAPYDYKNIKKNAYEYAKSMASLEQELKFAHTVMSHF